MKNKFIKIIFIIFTLSNNLFAEGFEFSSDNLQVLKNGNLLTGDGNVQIVSPEEIIKAEKFEYDKTNYYLKLTGNVSILNKTDNTILYGNRVDYFKNDEKIIINDDVKIIIENKYTIYFDNIIQLNSFSRASKLFKISSLTSSAFGPLHSYQGPLILCCYIYIEIKSIFSLIGSGGTIGSFSFHIFTTQPPFTHLIDSYGKRFCDEL